MNRISDAQIQEIKDSNRIEDVIREYIKLKPSGSGYTGLCPFHPDKNPSLSVSPSRQIFKCFSCNVGGDVVHFVSNYQNVSYFEALKLLADRAGIRLSDDNYVPTKRDEIRKKITLVNKETAKYYYSQLVKTDAPRKYLAGRGITAECVKKFGLGFAPDTWTGLTDYLVSKGYDKEFLEKAGLSVKSKNDSYVDKFRNRVMIPIFDVNGNVIAFGGRVMDDSKPKYMNSAETELYTKGNHLYGLNIAKRSLNKQRCIMVEGYMDCISLQNKGIDYAVASLGTALTVAQAKLAMKYFDETVLCYDSDEAGIKATKRAIDILESVGARVKVMSVPDGKDPDEFLRKHSPEEFEKLAESADTAVEYKIKMLKKQYYDDSADSMVKFAEGAVNVFAEIEDKTARDMYMQWFCKKYSFARDSITFDVNKRAREIQEEKQNENFRRPVQPGIAKNENVLTMETTGDKQEEQSEENPKKESGFKNEIEHYKGGKQLGIRLFNMEMTIPVLFSENVICVDRYKEKISEEFFTFTDPARLYKKLKDAALCGATNYGFGILLDGTDSEVASVLVGLEKETGLTGDVFAAVDELIKRIKLLSFDAEIAENRQKLKYSDENDPQRGIYMQKINQLLIEKGKLK